MDLQTKQRKEMFAKFGEQAKFGLGSGPAFEKADASNINDRILANINSALEELG